ncbi:flagellar biosynthesis protein FlhF [Anaeromicropila populeti]|uniref:Flagellar biosynthesis protein FlhF n=1 Tax=Anaeromicropila populeti TaxID=37658 RepID=A0A1I6KXI8_9FIRM|nr:flagellar biosynthesis protein FlhF [Anaeromicropila populeti]SFR95921.1 flagellar biosynthesis protein FlhF [Anaeromicropila populeti]
MIIKKFEAETETEAMLLVKKELGKDAIVLNMKTIRPRGIYRFWRKKMVEITAAVDDNVSKDKAEGQTIDSGLRKADNLQPASNTKRFMDFLESEDRLGTLSTGTSENAIEKKLNNLQELLEQQIKEKPEIKNADNKAEEKQDACIELIQEQLINNEVDQVFVKQIMDEISKSIKKDSSVDSVLSSVYQKIILKLGQPKFIELEEGKRKCVFFIGPTGVGKTTTIAKIASNLKLKQKAKVSLITSDTYRIAAVEQLRTYANILGIPLSVVYTKEELEAEKKKYEDYDILLIDTAGRSHKNNEQQEDMKQLIDTIPEDEREVFLVLSATTKYKDLIKITERYSEITDYSLIFTKLDETSSLGNILNVKLLTKAPLSYTTWGQNVPDDISNIDAQSIAKKLLGGND